MDRLNEIIDEIPELSPSVSVLNLVKYSKQAYYNGNPKYYQLPNGQERAFILEFTKNSEAYNGSGRACRAYWDVGVVKYGFNRRRCN